MCRHIAIVLPNRPGQFHRIATLLGDNQVNILGFQLSSEAGVGILHLICDPHDKAFQLLRDVYKFYCNEREVVAISMKNKPGQLGNVLKLLADRGINLPTAYQLILPSQDACVIMEFDSAESLRQAGIVMSENDIRLIDNIPGK